MNKKVLTINPCDAKIAKMPKKLEWMVVVVVAEEVTGTLVVVVEEVEFATHFKTVIAIKVHNVDSVTKVEEVVAVEEAVGVVVEEEDEVVVAVVEGMVTETEAMATETVEAEVVEEEEEECAMHSRKAIVRGVVRADSVTTRFIYMDFTYRKIWREK